MLTNLDEVLHHQIPATFDQVGTSDHRFYDRCWLSAYHPDLSMRVVTGMGCYPNMNVVDGYGVIQHDRRQYNVRVSRQLRPNLDDHRVGPLSVEVVEPLRTLRVVLAPGDAPLSFDLTWAGVTTPVESDHSLRMHGRNVMDVHCYMQLHRVSGWISLAGKRFEADNWFGARDHNWGVRPGVGGWEPMTGPPVGAEESVLFALGLTPDVGIYLDVHEGPRGYVHGVVQPRNQPPEQVTDVSYEIDYDEGSAWYRRAAILLRTESGEKYEIAVEREAAWAMIGSGYHGGFDDGKGLGAHRGEFHQEYDVYDVSDPEGARLPDGRTIRPRHRETIARITVNGTPGQAHTLIIPSGGFGDVLTAQVEGEKTGKGNGETSSERGLSD